MLNYTLAAAVISICVGYAHSSTLPAIVCDEPNTEYSSCKSNCTDKCPLVPPQACTLICYEGCFCKQDYSRALNGTCIPTENCPVQCPDDEVFGKRCTDTCIEDRIRCRESFYGCFCKPGLKRIEGKCVPEGKCFNCSKNEVYNECSNLCQDSCSGNETVFCPALCIKGCSCQSNYKRDPQTNKCIPSEKCKSPIV